MVGILLENFFKEIIWCTSGNIFDAFKQPNFFARFRDFAGPPIYAWEQRRQSAHQSRTALAFLASFNTMSSGVMEGPSDSLQLGLTKLTEVDAHDELHRILGRRVELAVAPQALLLGASNRLHGKIWEGKLGKHRRGA